MSITFDFSFVEETLNYLRSKNVKPPEELFEHPAAQLVHAHYLFFHFSGKKLDLKELWTEILVDLQKKEENYYQEVEDSLSYLKKNEVEFCRIAKEETLSYAPKTFELNSTIFMILGYDMGIAFNGDIASKSETDNIRVFATLYNLTGAAITGVVSYYAEELKI